ncbi:MULTISPECIES: hypothetical protein [unclassified Chryseobacterium]|uniref:hypothetical protein n=1 Tax=unclassified Chryseobacterium TaxID=2593645 RepID=UPI00226A83B4|nr:MULTISPECIES: hypothetical protein [unclassified Chryseobacterium]
MIKKIFYLFIVNISLSCVKDTERIGMNCYVYDFDTKKPINEVKVFQLVNGEEQIIARTSINGNFKVGEVTKLKIGMESHKLATLILLKKEGYVTDTIETYGNKNDLYHEDSIFLKNNLSIQ